MITVDLKSLLARLDPACAAALQNAAGLAVSRGHGEVALEHLFLKLLERPQCDFSLILARARADRGRLEQAVRASLEAFRGGHPGRPVFSPALIDLLRDAWMISSIDLGCDQVRSGSVLLAFLDRPALQLAWNCGAALEGLGRERVATAFAELAAGSEEAGPAAAEAPEGSFIRRFCVDFTAQARAGRIDPVFGRDAEIRRMVDILARRRKNNPICVGEPGVGKTALVEGLALRISQGDVPDLLKGARLLGLDLGLLEAGAGMKGEFEARLKGVIAEIKASPGPVVLFIDEAHTLIGAGNAAGAGDAANLLKPALARGELRTVAATTWREYKMHFEKDPALARRFQLVKLDPPRVPDTVLILRGLRDGYEQAHGVVIRDDAIVAAAELADRYITGRFLPDKAIDLLDTACARVRIDLTTQPPALEDLLRGIQALERERAGLERDRAHGAPVAEVRLRDLEADLAARSAQAAALRERWLAEQRAAREVLRQREEGDPAALAAASAALAALQAGGPLIRTEVDPDGVGQVVSDWTGIPAGRVKRDEAAAILHLQERLGARIQGQDHALAALAEVLQAAKAGLKDPAQPLGVFLFAGPSGVGKTETALGLAELLFGSERSLVTVNLGEFQEKHTVSRLVGSPPGYVGYGEGGVLTEAVRQKPYSVVLLDEAEKAHPDVLNLFYQVFDKGVLQDGEGKEIDFRNTIVILTSNLGAGRIQELCAAGGVAPEAAARAIRPELSRHFKPALLARMTVVPFLSLDPDALRRIAALKLARVARTLAGNTGLALAFDQAVVDRVAARCQAVEAGAREIDAILNGSVLPELSREILARMGGGGFPAAARLRLDEGGGFQFEFQA